MNSPSSFQKQYPLSGRKFWKKLITKAHIILFLGVFASMIVMLLLLVQKPSFGLGTAIFLFVLTFLGLSALFFAIYGLYLSAYIRLYYYDALDQFLTIQKGVFAPTEIHVPYGKIQDVYVDQDVLDRIMGLYDVHIASATVTSGIEGHIDGVDRQVAEELKNFLLNKIQFGNRPIEQGVAESQSQPPTSIPQGPSANIFNSKSYPISTAWLISVFIMKLWAAALFTFFIWFILFGRRTVIYQLSFSQTLIIYVIIYIALVVWSILWKRSFYFEFSPQFILMKSGVVSREEKHVPYRTVQNVLLKRTVLDRVFGLSTVLIENAAIGTAKTGRASRIILPGQPVQKGMELVNELNRILGQTSDRDTGL